MARTTRCVLASIAASPSSWSDAVASMGVALVGTRAERATEIERKRYGKNEKKKNRSCIVVRVGENEVKKWGGER